MKLHLGCGKRFIKGFVHIDILDYPHIDHISSIDNLSFIVDNSVDLIYNCHVLEHFKINDVARVVKEWNRVLKPNGLLRSSVPDFKRICKVYTNTENLDLVKGPVFGRQDYLYNIHYNIFDKKSLTTLFEENNFYNVREYDWRETEHAEVDDYSQAYIPHMDKENGTLISLNLECNKKN